MNSLLQPEPSEQEPHEPPQPSDPHALPWHDGVHSASLSATTSPWVYGLTHKPSPEQMSWAGQVPHSPLQPSDPHCFPSQLGVHSPSIETHFPV